MQQGTRNQNLKKFGNGTGLTKPNEILIPSVKWIGIRIPGRSVILMIVSEKSHQKLLDYIKFLFKKRFEVDKKRDYFK